MSYSNGFHYSPYYQGNAEQDGRNQQSYQNPSRGNTTSYQRPAYPSMASTPTTQPYPSAQASLGATSTSNGGYHTARAGTQTHGPPAMSHYPASSRSSIDTTALGNLAYASSLGQDSRSHPAPARNNSSMQQIVDYNRSQPTNSFSGPPLYGTNAPSVNEYDPRRSENRETASTRSTDMQNTYASPYTMYAHDANRQPQAYAPNQENASSPQGIHRPDSAARKTGGVSKQTSLAHPPRPASGQNVRLPQSLNQPTPLNKAASNGSHVSEHSHPQPQQMSDAPPRPALASSPTFQSSHTSTTRGQLGENQSRYQNHSPSLNHRANVDNREQSLQRDTQIPTTIDPNKIFNQVEHLKRQAAIAAEAEATKKAAEDAARKKAEAEAQALVDDSANSSFPNQMELEMTQMIEKMRDYKAKDPNLFSRIWEQVKKGQPANRASSAKEPSNSEPNDKNAPTIIGNGQLPSPGSAQNQLPLESELSIPPLQQNKPDQAKPPVQRRKRRSVKDPTTKLAPRRQTSGAAKVTPQATPVVRPSSAGHTSSAGPTNLGLSSESASLAPGAQSMQAAMESFNNNRNPQGQSHTQTEDSPEVVYVSGAGPFVPLSTETALPTESHASGSGPVVSTSAETAPVPSTATESPPRVTRTSGGTIWPQEKKWALANAARDALMSISMNAGKSIAAEDIVKLLDQSPSYAELCEILERRGFIIDRGHFARLLLTAVPSLDSDNPGAQNSSTLNVSKSHSDPSSGSPTLVNSDNDLDPLIKSHNDLSHDHSGQNDSGRNDTGRNDSGSNEADHAQNGVINRQSEVTNANGNVLVNTGTPHSVREGLQNKRGRKPKSSIENGEHPFVHFGLLVPPGHNQPVFSSTDRPGSSHVQWVAQDTSRTENDGGRFNQFRMNRINQPQENIVPMPLTKKELAKKRSFAELVDLTQDVSDEEDKLQEMKAKLDMIQNLNDAPLNQSSFMSAPDAAFDGPALDGPTSNFVDLALPKGKRKYKKRLGGSADRTGLSSAGVTEDEGLDLTKFKYAKSQHDLLQSKIIIRPINKKNDALRRSTYNPKTIARDILVSAGKHPAMAPLNHHLEILRSRFIHVDSNSDLGTFRWDLVDPGGLEAPSAEPQDVDMNDADDEDVGLRNGVQVERRRMRVASIIDGEAVLVSETNVIQPAKNMPSNRKWKKPRGRGVDVQERGDGMVSAPQCPGAVLANKNDGKRGQEVEYLEEGSMNFVRNPDEEAAISSNLITSPLPHKSPRGRPPGFGKKFRKNGFQPKPRSQEPTQSSPHFQSTPQSGSRPQEAGSGASEPRKRGRPPGLKGRPKAESSGNKLTTISPRPMPSDTVPLRPSGLRNILTPSDGVAVIIETHSTSFGDNGKKRKGVSKESRKRARPSSMQPSTQSFKVYKCLWQNCPYELHNLETLRKHVRKHSDEFEASSILCLWDNCGVTKEDREESEKPEEHEVEEKKLEPFEFESDAAWDHHMKKHVDRYAWQFGDGPSTHPSDAEVSDYLSDSQGRRVTPLVTADSMAPPDPLPLSAGKRAARAYHKAHGNVTDAQKAQAEADSARAQK